jgi:hypothetical protein
MIHLASCLNKGRGVEAFGLGPRAGRTSTGGSGGGAGAGTGTSGSTGGGGGDGGGGTRGSTGGGGDETATATAAPAPAAAVIAAAEYLAKAAAAVGLYKLMTHSLKAPGFDPLSLAMNWKSGFKSWDFKCINLVPLRRGVRHGALQPGRVLRLGRGGRGWHSFHDVSLQTVKTSIADNHDGLFSQSDTRGWHFFPLLFCTKNTIRLQPSWSI